ncbi:multicopper oxidase family protein [Vagococcus sp. PNs007]|uniref:Multicopper oxidase family protein n=1 Tax=Vagococcus proximus TaxID=2991417 RepID=A0ABT5X3X4_9ENTE|nr:multicopper oxidase family protein [Vagococcus proximus]MDF0480689.1 multicopper oxidase family protein [Vagococcus proximus]
MIIKKIVPLLTLLLVGAGCTKKESLPENSKPETQSTVNKTNKGSENKITPGLYSLDYPSLVSNDPIKKIDLVINEIDYELDGKTFKRWVYTDKNNTPYYAGMPLILNKGQQATINVTNNTSADTNIHWHGLALPNDQDGPGLLIKKNGGTFTYNFTPDYTGTYWYHSHNRPVRDQVDNGMYGPLVILDDTDKTYTNDQLLVLDDWVVNNEEGHMQVEGDVDTVNGLTGQDIEPITVTNGDKTKLRLVQAATAKSTTLYFPEEVLITHTDGMPLEKPVYTKEITLAPGERYDVEMILSGKQDKTLEIKNDRDQGFSIPINYRYDAKQKNVPTFTKSTTTPKEIKTGDKDLTKPDIFVEMDSQMSSNGHEWTINREVFPDTESFDLKKDKPYVIRFKNNNHMSNHPMHIHGAHFKVLSEDGVPLTDAIWKDTIDVSPNGYTDILIQFDRVGEWMLHCHILDHEDGGMMTTINVA